MRLFAIGDLHLQGGDNKPMDVFGPQWEGHWERIADDWRRRVTGKDAVLIPGDITWAMQLNAAVPDLQMINGLPGRKVICKGNHDYWWGSLTQLRRSLPEGMTALQNDAADLGEFVVCGSRGWTFPTPDAPLSADDAKICSRELIRMELSLKQAVKMAGGRPIVVMMHYPPLFDQLHDSPFTRLLDRYPVHTCVYGHLHGAGIKAGFNGVWHGIRYRLVSCDSLGFTLAELPLDRPADVVKPVDQQDY